MATNGASKPTKNESADNNFPLFFKAPTPIDSARHAKAGLTPSDDLSFTRSTNSIPLNAVEFVEAAKYYPIVFTQGETVMPAALLGLEQTNYFVDEKKHWAAGSYVPAYVRRYPFIFMEVPEEKQFVLCVDEGAPQYKQTAGKNDLALFDGENPTPLTNSALEFCTDFQQHYQITRNFCDALKEADLLLPTKSDIKLTNGREIALTGFQIINEEKVRALSDAQLLDFHKKGWLPLIYFVLLSSSNWQKLTNIASARETK